MESVVINNNYSKFKGKKVLITGHTGFKGSWLLAWLSSLGADILGYALEPETNNGLFSFVSSNIKFKHVIADIRDKTRFESEMLNFQPDFIFHLAAQALVRKSYEIPAETYETNVIGTANILETVKKLQKKCSILIITTDKVYENKEIDYYYKETDELGGYDPYSSSKAATEILVQSFRNSFFNPNDYSEHKKAIATCRAGNVIGGGDWNKDRLVPDIIRSLLISKPVKIRSPHAIRPWQHVLEPLNGYLMLASLIDQDPLKYSGAYNFGPLPINHLPVKNLVEIVLNSWGNGSWEDTSEKKQPHEANLLKLNIDKAKTELNWNPKLSSEEAIKWTVDWYKQKGNNIFDFSLQQILNFQNL
jgi:CDP-glucose 4,6-dehydratase